MSASIHPTAKPFDVLSPGALKSCFPPPSPPPHNYSQTFLIYGMDTLRL